MGLLVLVRAARSRAVSNGARETRRAAGALLQFEMPRRRHVHVQLVPCAEIGLLFALLVLQPATMAHRDQSCWSLISPTGELNATAANVLGQCSGHSSADSSFACGGVANFVQMRRYLGNEDFALEAELLLQVVDGTAASVMFLSAAGDHFATKGDHVGLDGAVGPNKKDVMFLNGPHFGSKSETTPAPVADRWFHIKLSRVSGMLTVNLNGSKAFSVPIAFAVEGVALRPWRSTMRVRGLSICAPQLPVPGGPPPPPPPPPPPHGLVTVFTPGEAGIPIYRIPALCAAGPALVAFVEGRERQGGDFAIKRIMTKRSLDGGKTVRYHPSA